MTRLREESLRQLRETKDLLDDLQRQDPSFSKNGAGFTFEGQGLILSAPGTEAFKQDFARWDTLKRQATWRSSRRIPLAKKLQANASKDRLAAGVDDNAPAEYRTQVDSYFKAIAAGKQRRSRPMQFAYPLPWWLALVLAAAIGGVAFVAYRRPLAPLTPIAARDPGRLPRAGARDRRPVPVPSDRARAAARRERRRSCRCSSMCPAACV